MNKVNLNHSNKIILDYLINKKNNFNNNKIMKILLIHNNNNKEIKSNKMSRLQIMVKEIMIYLELNNNKILQ